MFHGRSLITGYSSTRPHAAPAHAIARRPAQPTRFCHLHLFIPHPLQPLRTSLLEHLELHLGRAEVREEAVLAVFPGALRRRILRSVLC